MILRAAQRGSVTQVLCSLLACCSLASTSAIPGIEVDLQAAFPAPPFLLELLETAAAENASSYLPLLDTVAAGRFTSAANDEQLYSQFLGVLQQDGHISDPATLSSFKLALAVHEAAPRIEAQYQYWRTAVLAQLPHDAADEQIKVQGFEDKSQAVQVWRKGGLLCADVTCSGTVEGGAHGGQDHTTKTLQFDRPQGPPASTEELWTLYVDPTAPEFASSYHAWREAHPDASFRVRWKPPHVSANTPLVVNGYGVELALKRTDYIVIDDRQDQDGNKDNAKTAAVNLDEGGEEDTKLTPLTSSELQELGIKAASFIMESQDQLDTLHRVVRDFPKHAAALAAHDTSASFVDEQRANTQLVPAGMSVMWINGVQITARDVNAFSLLEHLRKERKLISSIQELGFSPEEAVNLLSHEAITQPQVEQDVQRYDWRDTTEGENVIIWLNDLEKDKRYAQWPTTAKSLLQRTYPGQLPAVAKDLQNIVLPIDITKRDDLVTVVDTLQNLVKRQIAARFGIVPLALTPTAIEHAKVVYHLNDAYGLSAVISYLESVGTSRKIGGASSDAFTVAITDRKLRRDKVELPLSDVLASEDLETNVDSAREYLARLGADKPDAPYFANGAPIASNDDWLQTMSNRISMDLRLVQQAVFEERLGDDDWLPSIFLESASFKRNSLIVPEDESSIRIIDVGQLVKDHPDIFTEAQLQAESNALDKTILTILYDTGAASGVLIEAVRFDVQHPDVEVNYVINGNTLDGYEFSELSAILHKIDPPIEQEVQQQMKLKLNDLKFSSRGQHAHHLHKVLQTLGVDQHASGLMLNGRLIALPNGHAFSVSDFEDLVAYERQKRVLPVINAVKALRLESKINSAIDLARLTSLIALSNTNDMPEGIYDNSPGPRINMIPRWQDEHTCIKKGDISTAQLQIVVLLDPAAELAQQWVPVLKVLSELKGVHVRVYLNPQDKLSELPIKRFYRQVLRSQPLFADDGTLKGLSARFSGIPQEALLTITMHTPPSWLVAPKVSVHDLDNIKLSSLKGASSVTATYELEHILVEGHSRDVTNGNAPRGVQLGLSTDTNPALAGTIIMANLGYFQFKVNPGVYSLSLQRGRSQEIFNLDSAGILGQTAANSTDIALLSFQGTTLFPRLSRKEGKRLEDVLETSTSPSDTIDTIVSKGAELADEILSKTGLVDTKAGSYVQKLLGKAGMNTSITTSRKHADINIFSVASGHLYERMLNIMMVSVLRNTKHTVKFWFIEQFLSPSFKQFLPHLAAHYKFDFEMVTYAWPHWLRAQKEKQRVIWGYKILFLDVLFPLDLDKVIFVDADQIVRTDMHDLVTHDLEGAPYGFTPMCDSRTEMEGYRFWKQGYWKTFLRGAPYHISALYVVDLKRFRAIAAGDRLRQQYHQLSADPASLSNLDQDLPNHMQHVLPIHSLPQDWLWCETWCSDEALKTARTIDLCNNPETKEPKLDRARRQVPEWTVYDDEIAEVAKRVAERGEEVRVLQEGGVQEAEVQSAGAGERVVKAQESGAAPAGNVVVDGREQQIRDEL